jgi:hypothetical protein
MQLACLPANHSDLGDTYFDFGRVYESTNMLDEAADYYTRALKVREAASPVNHTDKIAAENCIRRVNDLRANKRSMPRT